MQSASPKRVVRLSRRAVSFEEDNLSRRKILKNLGFFHKKTLNYFDVPSGVVCVFGKPHTEDEKEREKHVATSDTQRGE